MSEQREQNQIEKIFTILETKLADKTWSDAQEPEFIKALEGTKNVIQNISSNMFIMLDLFQQYTEAIYQSPIFVDLVDQKVSQDGNVNPTQTAPAPANRAEKRAEKRAIAKSADATKSGILVPEKKLIIP